MTLIMRRKHLLLLFSFIVLLPVVCLSDAIKDLGENDIEIQHSDQEILSPNAELKAPVEEQSAGAHAYNEAQTILHRLETGRRLRINRFSKSNNTLALAWHYVKKIFTLFFLNAPTTTTSLRNRKISGPLHEAVIHLQTAIEAGNSDALFTLADLNFYGTHGHPINYTAAYQGYEKAAVLGSGNASAYHMMGFMHATGIGGVPKDQAKAVLYHTFAANAGDSRAQMTMAFRYHSGIGVLRDCEKAVVLYKKVADKAIEYARTGPPGGRRPSKEAYHIADDEGGVYGEGASFSSAGIRARGGSPPDSHSNMDNYLDYLDLLARKGDPRATFRLGQYYYEGSRFLPQDFSTAKEFFLEVARRHWSKDGKIRGDTDSENIRLASHAAGYLGCMFLRGEGVTQDFTKARIWFKRGIENGDSTCQYFMGIMHLYGHGVDQDPIKAADLLGAAADNEHPAAQARYGELMMDQGDLAAATRYFELAVHHGNTFGMYYLAELSNLGAGRDRSCPTSVQFYKIVAEKLPTLHSLDEAHDAYDEGDTDTALTLYMQAAEQGYEVGQANVAYVLDKSTRSYTTPLQAAFPSLFKHSAARLSTAALALTYWTRSARQANIDSLIKMGDYYLSGLGSFSPFNVTTSGSTSFSPSTSASDFTTAADLTSDPHKAASCYHAAADTQLSAQAYYNLGWMHEHGLGGLSQDFHLAKRFYDHAYETNGEAYLPVTLALAKLRLRGTWNWLRGKGATLASPPPGSAAEAEAADAPVAEARSRTLGQWILEFLVADLERNLEAMEGGEGLGAPEGAEDWDGGLAGGEEVYGWGGAGEEDVQAIVESLVILVLAAVLAILVWWRQTVRRARERQQDRGNGRAGARVGEPGRSAGNATNVEGSSQQTPPNTHQHGDREHDAREPGNGAPGWAVGGVGH